MQEILSISASINSVDALKRTLKNMSPRPLGLRRPRTNDVHEMTSEEKLIDASVGAHDVLFSANTIWPFVLFPDTISMDRQQLTIVHRTFFRVANTVTIRIDDILNIESNVGPFFGSVHLFSKFFTNDLKSINFLSRVDALKIQRLIQGYTIAHHRKIDCSGIEKGQLINLLSSLGGGATATQQ